MSDELIVPEKTSRWTDAEREKVAVPAVPEPVVPVDNGPARPEFPPWLGSFEPGGVLSHNGWDCAIRHIGCEENRWMVLIEPMVFTPPRKASRSEFRRLRTQIGKKAAKAALAERGQEVPVSQEEYDAGE